MKISELPKHLIHLGLRLRSLDNAFKLGTLSKHESLRGQDYWWIQWDDDQDVSSGFFWNDCECEVLIDKMHEAFALDLRELALTFPCQMCVIKGDSCCHKPLMDGKTDGEVVSRIKFHLENRKKISPEKLQELHGRMVSHQVVGDTAVVLLTAQELGELLNAVK